jgi:hypothetical protein
MFCIVAPTACLARVLVENDTLCACQHADSAHNDTCLCVEPVVQVKFLVEDDHRDVNELGVPPQRWRPLHCAAVCGRMDVAAYLLTKGAQPSAQDGDGWTPLHLSASRGEERLTELLCECLLHRLHLSISTPMDARNPMFFLSGLFCPKKDVLTKAMPARIGSGGSGRRQGQGQ